MRLLLASLLLHYRSGSLRRGFQRVVPFIYFRLHISFAYSFYSLYMSVVKLAIVFVARTRGRAIIRRNVVCNGLEILIVRASIVLCLVPRWVCALPVGKAARKFFQNTPILIIHLQYFRDLFRWDDRLCCGMDTSMHPDYFTSCSTPTPQ